MMQGLEGVRFRQAFPGRAEGIIAQTEGLVRTLEDHAVIVNRPRSLTDAEMASGPVGLFSQYTRDPQVVIGKHIIETNLRAICRHKEHPLSENR